MSHVLYAYIAKPTTTQVGSFLRALADRDVLISHLGKNDPPRKFAGSIDQAVSMVFSGRELTDWTFARDAARRLDFDFQDSPRPTVDTFALEMPCLGRFDTLEPDEESTRSVQQLNRNAVAARMSEQDVERGRYIAPVAATVARQVQYLADVVLSVRQLALVEVANQFIEEGAAFRV